MIKLSRQPVELVLQLLGPPHLADLTICVEPVELVLQLLRPPHLAVPGQDQHRLLPHQQLPLRYRTDIKHNTLFFINYKKTQLNRKFASVGGFSSLTLDFTVYTVNLLVLRVFPL